DEEFRPRGKDMIHYIADYLINISECHAAAEIDSGYLRLMLP
ncbi:unnamed protein product, partial [Rotaria sp. Silwood1]